MDLRKLKTLIDLVSESGVAELEITEGQLPAEQRDPDTGGQRNASSAPTF